MTAKSYVSMLKLDSKSSTSKSNKKQKIPFKPSFNSPYERIMFLQQKIGNRAVGRLLTSGLLQPKLMQLKEGEPKLQYTVKIDVVPQAKHTSASVQRSWDTRYGTPRARPGNLKYEDYKANIGKQGAGSYAPELKDASDWGGKQVDPVRLTREELGRIMKPEIPKKADSSVKEQATQTHEQRLEEYLPHINDAFETMGINTVKAQALYLAHAAGETGTLSRLTEMPNSQTDRYKPFVGRGPLHTTFKHGYVQALAYLEKKKEQLKQVAQTKEREVKKLKQQVTPKGENYALAALALAEARSAHKKADLAQEAFQAIKGNLEEAANPKYSFIFGAAYMHMSGMVKRAKRLGNTASFAGSGLENVGMTGGASSISMSNRAKIKRATYERAISVLSKKAVDYKPDYLRE